MGITIAQSKSTDKKISELKLGDTFEYIGQYYIVSQYKCDSDGYYGLYVNLITGKSQTLLSTLIVHLVNLILTEEPNE